jgi:hypothetical protein
MGRETPLSFQNAEKFGGTMVKEETKCWKYGKWRDESKTRVYTYLFKSKIYEKREQIQVNSVSEKISL